MKQFDLEEFKKNPSRKVVTRYGKQARIICTDAKGESPVIALVEDNGEEHAFSYHKDGAWSKKNTSDVDLFFDTDTNEGLVNLYSRETVFNFFCFFRKTKE